MILIGATKRVAESSNLHSSDVLHLVTAWVSNCRYLITRDSFFKKEGTLILQKEEVKTLEICAPEELIKKLKK